MNRAAKKSNGISLTYPTYNVSDIKCRNNYINITKNTRAVLCVTYKHMSVHHKQTFTSVTSRPARCRRGATFFSYKSRPLLQQQISHQRNKMVFYDSNTGTEHTYAKPFYDSLDFVRDNIGKPVLEETFTHSHLLWSSVIPYLLPSSIMIHYIFPVQCTCLTVCFHNLSPSLLWSTSWPGTLHFILHSFVHPRTCPYHRNLFCCSTEIMSSNPSRVGWNKFRQLVPLLINKDISLIVRGRLYSSCVRSSVLHGSETWLVRKENKVALQRQR